MACLTSSPSLARSQPVITIDGTARLAPISQEAARLYHELIKDTAKVSVKASGTANGFKNFCRGELNVSAANRPMVRAELELCKGGGGEYYEIPIAYDVLTIIVNAQNHWAHSITMDALKRLWERSGQNQISRWNHLQPLWPPYSIRLFSSPPDSEIFEFFAEAMQSGAKGLRSDATHLSSSSEIVRAVSGNPSAIGYCPIAECAKKTTGTKVLSIDFGQGPIAPSALTVQNNRYRQLARPLFLYINRKSTEQIDIHRFVALYLLRARQLVGLAGYLPLADRAYKIAVNVMKNKKVGSAYGGVVPGDLTIDEFITSNAGLR